MFSYTQDVVVEEWKILKYWWRRNISLQTLKQKGPSCRSSVHHTISCFTANMDPLWSLFHVCVIGHNPFLAEEGGGWVPHGRCETHAWGHTFEKWTTGWPWPRSSKPNNALCYITHENIHIQFTHLLIEALHLPEPQLFSECIYEESCYYSLFSQCHLRITSAYFSGFTGKSCPLS